MLGMSKSLLFLLLFLFLPSAIARHLACYSNRVHLLESGWTSCVRLGETTAHSSRPDFQGLAAAGVPRLFDLVRVRDAKLRAAFFYALGDTLVAEHLEQASRIAYGGNRRWARVVTLQVRQPCHVAEATTLQ